MKEKNRIVVQGYPGCFHDEAARKFFISDKHEIIPSNSFNELARTLDEDKGIDFGIMAIENSIAGSLLQNYRILREHKFWIFGEVYLRIKHNLMALPRQSLEEIKEVCSHPMALNQCLRFLHSYKNLKLVETEDTALSAKHIQDKQLKGSAAIGSELAAKLYGLEVLVPGIETSKVNYTRFFILQRHNGQDIESNANKASIWIRIRHERGSLLDVLKRVYDHHINMSKLQSYPVLGKLSEYFFHIDLQFDHITQYTSLIEELQTTTLELEVLGVYRKASIYDHQTV